jgi:histidinol-phosphate aminotransferase
VKDLDLAVRKEVQELGAYPAGKPISEVKREYGLSDIIKLASNENPLGCSPKAVKAIADLLGGYNMYPDPSVHELKRKISEKLGVNFDQVFCGAGSDLLIRNICSAFINQGDESVVGEVTFSRYADSTLLMGGSVIRVPLKNNALDINSMVDTITPRTKIIWFCNPNNPTGTIFTDKEFRCALDRIPKNVLIVMDEAYYEYVASGDYPESLSYLPDYPNMVILRTFSKAYGLAGLRVGYGVASSELAGYFNAISGPFDVNLIAQTGACAALDDSEFLRKTRETNDLGREYLYREFESMGLPYINTETNFIMVKTPADDIKVFNELLKRGIIVKSGTSLKMPGYLRVTIGSMEQNEKFISKLKEIAF